MRLMGPDKIRDGKWVARLRYGSGRRDRFVILAGSSRAAQERYDRMARMASELAACPDRAKAKDVLEAAGAAQSERDLLGLEQLARELCSGVVAVRRDGGSRATFRSVAEMWLSGELHRQHPRRIRKKKDSSVAMDRGRVTALSRELGDVAISAITLDVAERALTAATPSDASQSTARQYAQVLSRVLRLAAYPLKLIERSPLPPDFVPPKGKAPAFTFLYPEEDALLMRCAKVPMGYRIIYGFLAREGLRISEAMSLTWRDLDLERGVIALDRNKTDTPRVWALGADVVEALGAYRGSADPDDVVFPEFILDRSSKRLRAHLLDAGVTRREIHVRTAERHPLRIHDLRGTFVTLALASGWPERKVMDRTGHTTSAMLAVYARPARFATELGWGWPEPLDALLGLRKSEVSTEMGQLLGHAVRSEPDSSESGRIRRSAALPHEAAPQPPRASSAESSPSLGPAGPGPSVEVGHESSVEIALARALSAATEAGEWEVVQTLARELSERRRERTAPSVPSLETRRARKEAR